MVDGEASLLDRIRSENQRPMVLTAIQPLVGSSVRSSACRTQDVRAAVAAAAIKPATTARRIALEKCIKKCLRLSKNGNDCHPKYMQVISWAGNASVPSNDVALLICFVHHDMPTCHSHGLWRQW